MTSLFHRLFESCKTEVMAIGRETLGKTLYHWRDEVVRMWRFSKSSGITEGFHRKMKLIQRRAYGFKNFENYRLRVKVLCA